MNFYFTFQRIGKFFKLSNRNIFETVDNNKNFQFAVMKIIECQSTLLTFHRISQNSIFRISNKS